MSQFRATVEDLVAVYRGETPDGTYVPEDVMDKLRRMIVL